MSMGAYRGAPQSGGGAKRDTLSVTLNPSRFYAGPDGRTYCDIPAQFGTAVPLRGIPVYMGTGTPDQFSQPALPASVNTAAPSLLPQVMVFFAGFERVPIALAELSPQGTAQNVDAAVEDGIRDTALPVTSHRTKNGGTLETLDNTGRKTIDLRGATDPNMGVQLPADGRLIVSRAGDFSGRLTLVDELVGYIDDLNVKLDLLATYVHALQIAAGIIPTPPTVTFPDPSTYTLGAAVLPVAPDAE